MKRRGVCCQGLLTYGSLMWGAVDWPMFDLIGVDALAELAAAWPSAQPALRAAGVTGGRRLGEGTA
jgi:hypothetical protein